MGVWALVNVGLWAAVLTWISAAVGSRVLQDYRVPAAVEPSHYTLKMLTSLSDDFDFVGEVWITVAAKSSVDTITLNYKNLDIFENATSIERISAISKREVHSDHKKKSVMHGRKKMGHERATNEETEIPVVAEDGSANKEDQATTMKTLTSSTVLPPSSTQSPTIANAKDPSAINQQSSLDSDPAEMSEPDNRPSDVIAEMLQGATSEAAIETTPNPPILIASEPSGSDKPESVEMPQEAPLKPEESPVTPANVDLVDTLGAGNEDNSAKPAEPPQVAEPAATQKPAESKPEIDDGPLAVVTHDYDSERQFLTLSLSRALQPGENYKIYLKFQGFLSDNLTGYYRVAYTKRSRKTSWAAATTFEPMDARSAFPCFDEPEYKATFDITLGHSSDYKALSNMPLKSTKLINGTPGWQWDTFETTPRMSTYLVAFLISDFDNLEDNKASLRNSTQFRFWARHDVIHKARYAAKVTHKMHSYLQELLQVTDVMPKYDLVAMPSFISNALENWGLISFSERSLLYSPGSSSILSKYETTRLLGHELSHSWFGNSLTPRWWDQIWLSEGLSNFFETKAADHVQPDWDVITFSAVSSYLRVFTLDALHTTHALVPTVRNLHDINEIFDSITYQKGYYLTRMMNHTMGEECFLAGIRDYVRNHQNGLVEEEDLWTALTPRARDEGKLPLGVGLSEVMKAWTREPGYPVVKVIRNYANRTATLTQTRFLRPKEDYELRSQNGTESTRWYIPISYTTGREMRFADTVPRLWLRPEQQELVLQDVADETDFILMNIDATGLYRVNYDYDNWALLIDGLLSENYTQISVINRVQILDDLLDFARAGEIQYKIALDATSYLRREKHYLPWKAAFSNFEFISRMMRSTDSGKLFKKFMRNLVSERYEELGFEPKTEESLFESMNRKQIVKWACRTGHKQCVRTSVNLFRKWTNEKKPDEINPIPSNLRSVVYCTAIEQGGARDWQFLWQRYLSNTVVTDKAAIIAGLGCSRNTRTLSKYLDWSLKETSGLKKQDSVAVFKAVSSNDVGYPLAKKFLRERLSEVPKYVGSSSNGRHVPQMVDALARKMNQAQDLQGLEELEQENAPVLKVSPRTMQQAMEKVRFNIGWVQTNLQPISDWLKRQTSIS